MAIFAVLQSSCNQGRAEATLGADAASAGAARLPNSAPNAREGSAPNLTEAAASTIAKLTDKRLFSLQPQDVRAHLPGVDLSLERKSVQQWIIEGTSAAPIHGAIVFGRQGSGWNMKEARVNLSPSLKDLPSLYDLALKELIRRTRKKPTFGEATPRGARSAGWTLSPDREFVLREDDGRGGKTAPVVGFSVYIPDGP